MKTTSDNSEGLSPSLSLLERQPYIRPLKYELEFSFPTKAERANGTTKILINVTHPEKKIFLHSLNLIISDAKLHFNDVVLIPSNIVSENKDETVCFVFSQEIVGKVVLEITYTAYIYHSFDKSEGIYYSFYPNGSGSPERGYATHFEPCHARKAFPCFDEPSLRAEFKMTIIVDGYFDVLSNMPLEGVEEVQREGSGGERGTQSPSVNALNDSPSGDSSSSSSSTNKRIWKFEWTPSIPSYLVTFVVGQYHFLESKVRVDYDLEGKVDNKEVKLRTYTPLNRSECGQFCMELAQRAVHFYTNKLKIAYPSSKLDLIGLQNFCSLGMENWGCMHFAEDHFLVTDQTSLELKQRITRLIGHEVAHSWFGDLVTISTWKYLWLKEGFARYIEYVWTDYAFPEWRYWRHFLRAIFFGAIHRDAQIFNTHPVEVQQPHASYVTEMFDVISYGKGACVVRMICAFIGSDALWEGLTLLMQKYKWSAISTENLWEILSKVSPPSVGNISDVMNCWLNQSGHPIIEVDEIPDKKENGLTFLLIKQSSCHDNNLLWKVPIIIKTRELTNNYVLTDKTCEISVPSSSWIKLNWNHTGFYRTNYSLGMWDKISRAISDREIPVYDCIGLFEDACFFYRKKQLKACAIFKLIDAFVQIRDEYLWESVANLLTKWIYQSEFLECSQFLNKKVYTICETMLRHEQQQQNENWWIQNTPFQLTIVNLMLITNYSPKNFLIPTEFTLIPQHSREVYAAFVQQKGKSAFDKFIEDVKDNKDKTLKMSLLYGACHYSQSEPALQIIFRDYLNEVKFFKHAFVSQSGLRQDLWNKLSQTEKQDPRNDSDLRLYNRWFETLDKWCMSNLLQSHPLIPHIESRRGRVFVFNQHQHQHEDYLPSLSEFNEWSADS